MPIRYVEKGMVLNSKLTTLAIWFGQQVHTVHLQKIAWVEAVNCGSVATYDAQSL
ncbi:hypothetical protein VEE07_47000 (plasmid) [Escherichia coli]|nr:hypothetical protein VEE07_47000 [Escherichia coli]